jgi:hypothetical protein
MAVFPINKIGSIHYIERISFPAPPEALNEIVKKNFEENEER